MAKCLPNHEEIVAGHFTADGCVDEVSDFFAGTLNARDECTSDDSTYSSYANSYDDAWREQLGYGIGVQCCNMEGTSADRPGCVSSATFAEAVDVCDANGMRLCTLDEVKDTALTSACGTGCKFDHSSVWTSTECFVYVNRDAAKPAQPNVLDSAGSLVVDVSSRWVVAAMLIVAALLAMNLWRMGCVGVSCPKRKYVKVALADSEEFSEHEANAINIE